MPHDHTSSPLLVASFSKMPCQPFDFSSGLRRHQEALPGRFPSSV
ncbi:unnamed protein product [Arabidopsis lyrata]|nr:unnamed protein product [Arabidopsis lyrata]